MGCVTSAIFAVPMMKHFIAWTTATNADKMTIQTLIRKGMSPTICPGGVQEVFEMDADVDECVLYLKNRKGVVKLALEFGVPIIPSFTFGQRGAFSFWIPKGGWVKSVSKIIQFAPMVYFGLFGLPFAQPKRCPLTVVIGKPIVVPKMDSFTEEDVNKYHIQLIDALVKLYEDNKVQCGMGATALRVV
jgi:hypothetical protein